MIINKYPESVEESGNYLRLALQNISRHELPYNPLSYLLWYEYATGRNEQLIKDIELFLESKKPVTVKLISEFIKNHLTDNQVLLAEKKSREFQKILIEITNHLSQSGNEFDLKSNMLETCAIELNQTTSLETISEITNRIIIETKSMVKSSQALKGQLDSSVNEISMLSEELEGFKQAAKTDMLTSLLNRRGFNEAILNALDHTKKSHEPLSVIMLDIDHFKKVNDAYGHLIGDNVLRLLSKLIKDYIKGKDIAGRFGGEEFIIALPQTPLEGAYKLAEQIRINLKKINWKIKDTGKSLGQITISLGISRHQEGESVEDIIKRADDALYHAKNTGRDNTVTELDLVKDNFRN